MTPKKQADEKITVALFHISTEKGSLLSCTNSQPIQEAKASLSRLRSKLRNKRKEFSDSNSAFFVVFSVNFAVSTSLVYALQSSYHLERFLCGPFPTITMAQSTAAGNLCTEPHFGTRDNFKERTFSSQDPWGNAHSYR